MKKNRKKGFTLIELIIVIAILAILAGLLIPLMINYTKEAKVTVAHANLKILERSYQAVLVDALAKGWKTGEEIYLPFVEGNKDPIDKYLTDRLTEILGKDFPPYAVMARPETNECRMFFWPDGRDGDCYKLVNGAFEDP